MSIANGYDEISSTQPIALLKKAFNVMSEGAIRESLEVIEKSVKKDNEGIKEFLKRKKDERLQNQFRARETEQKTFSLDDFGERE